MTITGGSALPKDDIERMMREAEQYAEEDHKRRESAETRNQAEQLVYSTEKFLADNADKLPADVKTEVEAAIAELKEALKGEDVAAIREATEKVATTAQKLGQALYANADAAGAAGAEGGENVNCVQGRRRRRRRDRRRREAQGWCGDDGEGAGRGARRRLQRRRGRPEGPRRRRSRAPSDEAEGDSETRCRRSGAGASGPLTSSACRPSTQNYRRRVERDRARSVRSRSSTLLENLLPVLDDIGRAREHGEVDGRLQVGRRRPGDRRRQARPQRSARRASRSTRTCTRR